MAGEKFNRTRETLSNQDKAVKLLTEVVKLENNIEENMKELEKLNSSAKDLSGDEMREAVQRANILRAGIKRDKLKLDGYNHDIEKLEGVDVAKTKLDIQAGKYKSPINRRKEKQSRNSDELSLQIGKEFVKLDNDKLKELQEIVDGISGEVDQISVELLKEVLFLVDDDKILNMYSGEKIGALDFTKHRSMRRTDMMQYGGSFPLATMLIHAKQRLGEKQFVQSIVAIYNDIYSDSKIDSSIDSLDSLKGAKNFDQSKWLKVARLLTLRLNNTLSDGKNNVELSESKEQVLKAGFERFLVENAEKIEKASNKFEKDMSSVLTKKNIKQLKETLSKETFANEADRQTYQKLLDNPPTFARGIFLQSLYAGYVHHTDNITTHTDYYTRTDTKNVTINTDINGNTTTKTELIPGEYVFDETKTTHDHMITHVLTVGAQAGANLRKNLSYFLGGAVGAAKSPTEVVPLGSVYTGLSQHLPAGFSTSLTAILAGSSKGVTTGMALGLNWATKLNDAASTGKAQQTLGAGVSVGFDMKGTLNKGAYLSWGVDKVAGVNAFIDRMNNTLTRALTDSLIATKGELDLKAFQTNLEEAKLFDTATLAQMMVRFRTLFAISDISDSIKAKIVSLKGNTDYTTKGELDVAIYKGLVEPVIRDIATELQQSTKKITFGGLAVSWADIAQLLATGGASMGATAIKAVSGSARLTTTKGNIVKSEVNKSSPVEVHKLVNTQVLENSLKPYFTYKLDASTGELVLTPTKGYIYIENEGDPDTIDIIVTTGMRVVVGADGTITTHKDDDTNHITIEVEQKTVDQTNKLLESKILEINNMLLPTFKEGKTMTDADWIKIKNNPWLHHTFKPHMDEVYSNGSYNEAQIKSFITGLKKNVPFIVIDENVTIEQQYEQLLYIRNKLTTSAVFDAIKTDTYDVSKNPTLTRYINSPSGKKYQNASGQEQLFHYRTGVLSQRINNEADARKYDKARLINEYLQVRQDSFDKNKNQIKTSEKMDNTFAINTGYDTTKLSEIFNTNPTIVGKVTQINTSDKKSEQLISYFMDSITHQTDIFVNYFKKFDSTLQGLSSVELAQKLVESVKSSTDHKHYEIKLDNGKVIKWSADIWFGFDWSCMNEAMGISNIKLITEAPQKPQPELFKIPITKTIHNTDDKYREQALNVKQDSTTLTGVVAKSVTNTIVHNREERINEQGEITTNIEVTQNKIETLVTVKQEGKEWIAIEHGGKTYLVEVVTDPQTGIVTVVPNGIVLEVTLESGTTYKPIFQGNRPKPIDAATKETVTGTTEQTIYETQRPKPIITTETTKKPIDHVGEYGSAGESTVTRSRLPIVTTISNLANVLEMLQ